MHTDVQRSSALHRWRCQVCSPANDKTLNSDKLPGATVEGTRSERVRRFGIPVTRHHVASSAENSVNSRVPKHEKKNNERGV